MRGVVKDGVAQRWTSTLKGGRGENEMHESGTWKRAKVEETNERARIAMRDSGGRDGILAAVFGVVYCSSHEEC